MVNIRKVASIGKYAAHEAGSAVMRSPKVRAGVGATKARMSKVPHSSAVGYVKRHKIGTALTVGTLAPTPLGGRRSSHTGRDSNPNY